MDVKINIIANDNLEYCLFCYEENKLINNKLCRCEYYYHQLCYEKWFLKKNNYNCIICQREIDFNFIFKKEEHGRYLNNFQINQNLRRITRRNIDRRQRIIILPSFIDTYFDYIWKTVFVLFIIFGFISFTAIILIFYVFTPLKI